MSATVLTMLLLLLTAVPGSAAPREGRASDTLKTNREALGQVRRQLEDARQRVSQARQREVSLLGELEDVDRTLVRKRGELRRLDSRIVRLEAELTVLQGRQGRVAEELVARQGALAARLRVLDQARHAPELPAPWLEEVGAARREQAVRDLVRLTGLELIQLVETDEAVERLGTRKAAVGQVRGELVELRRVVEAERALVDREAERRRALLTEVREDRTTHERMVAELEEAGRRLEALVRELARRARSRTVATRPSEPAPPRSPAIGLGTVRGQLPWPADGRVVAGFGRQIHPRFGTQTMRNGIDIEAAEGAQIRAVHAGEVIYRGWLKGYGNLVILDHGHGYYTLYAHASELLVAEGERVRAGQVIARVGETGSLAGPRLYFEVRYQGRPEDPEPWLRRRGGAERS